MTSSDDPQWENINFGNLTKLNYIAEDIFGHLLRKYHVYIFLYLISFMSEKAKY